MGRNQHNLPRFNIIGENSYQPVVDVYKGIERHTNFEDITRIVMTSFGRQNIDLPAVKKSSIVEPSWGFFKGISGMDSLCSGNMLFMPCSPAKLDLYGLWREKTKQFN